jgi:PAS domain S-box-containing protein
MRTSTFAYEQFFRDLFQNAPLGVAVLAGPDLRYTFVNRAYRAMSPEVDPLGKPHLEVFPADPGADQLRDVLESGASMSIGEGRWQRTALRLPQTGGEPAVCVISGESAAGRGADPLRSEAGLAAALHGIVDEIWIVDAGGNVLLMNEAARRHLGVAPDRWPNIHAALAELEIFSPDGAPRPAHSAPLQRALRGESLIGEREIVRNLATGELRWREVSCGPVRDAGGQIVGAAGIARDITENKQAEDALRNSATRFRQLFEAMQEGFFLAEVVTDASGRPVDYRHLEANPALERLTGIRRSDLIGRLVSEALPGIDRTWIEALGAVALTGKPAHFEQFAAPAGRWYGANAYSPQPGQFAATLFDVTDRKRTEQELRESQATLKAALASATDAVFITDAEGRFLHLNEAFAAFHRFRDKSDCLTNVAQYPDRFDVFLPDGSLAPYESRPTPRALRGESVVSAEYGVRCKKTGERWVGSYSFGPIRDGDARIVGAVVICRDITEQKRAEQKLWQTQKLESIGRLAGGIAHDFNNLLTGIMGNASLALDGAPPHVAQKLHEVMANAERAADLTRQLLAYSGKGRFMARDLDVTEAVNGIAGLAKTSIPRAVELEVTARGGLPIVHMDPANFEQVLVNLVINAGEAIGATSPGTIAVTTSLTWIDSAFIDAVGCEVRPGRYICIEVRDSGSGMDEATRSRIFDPFFTTKFTGRGLGLAAVAGILRAQQGRITVESAPGQGSIFRVLLPFADSFRETEASPTGAG